jgi:hypothetical protein
MDSLNSNVVFHSNQASHQSVWTNNPRLLDALLVTTSTVYGRSIGKRNDPPPARHRHDRVLDRLGAQTRAASPLMCNSRSRSEHTKHMPPTLTSLTSSCRPAQPKYSSPCHSFLRS